MSLNQRVIAEFSTCTPSAPQLRDLSIQTFRSSGLLQRKCARWHSQTLTRFSARESAFFRSVPMRLFL